MHVISLQGDGEPQGVLLVTMWQLQSRKGRVACLGKRHMTLILPVPMIEHAGYSGLLQGEVIPESDKRKQQVCKVAFSRTKGMELTGHQSIQHLSKGWTRVVSTLTWKGDMFWD